ncbi:MAG: hypothetical protein O7G87_15500, partial [bacterium]|nr:hypothetical protein [bacterium]
EKVAKKMQPLIQTAFQNGFSPNTGVAEAVLDAADEVLEGLPEWLGEIDGFYLKPTLTTCLLEWEWLKSQEKGQDGFAFARCILDWEDEVGHVGMEEDTFLDFFTRLPEADQEALYRGLADSKTIAPWNQHLENMYSHWYVLYMYYAESRAPEQYMNNLLATLSQRWQNGLTVIENLLAKKDYEQSLQAVEQTLEALLHSRHRDQSWTPDIALLFPMVSGYYHDSDFQDHKTVLRYYQQAARGLGQTELVKVLDIQRTSFNHFFDWDWMFKTFEETPVLGEVRQALFESWRDHIVRQAGLRTWHLGSESEHDPGWLDWLIESVSDVEKGSSWFQKKMDQWLARLPKEMHSSDEHFDCLRLLTRDLAEINGRKNDPYAAFFEVVIEPGELVTPDDKFRQKYLKAYAPVGLLDRIMGYWKKHVQISVPNPRYVHKADYTEHAQWMAVLKEMAPRRYQALLDEWRVEHHRRKNLWQAMEKMGLG